MLRQQPVPQQADCISGAEGLQVVHLCVHLRGEKHSGACIQAQACREPYR